ncbi:hypothetical protein CEUSTIGMA_g3654.t1 [Chlamydomonas eustigma]|uniref:Armadillo repeat-containing domain-containing protein n=1 Tax=Chlamydomonas eustigma TaxID=1157962 RepID=A0A250X0C2_9CHLO|nr:hypothetical protein CEUSTIGMA_g3654.t1 [Chlamydomonas eustigma]|eukprot:GAX76210.1 hypothetical protein CEUSTIGMA_g3654.t1 [Chlamydomonas eustigma]
MCSFKEYFTLTLRISTETTKELKNAFIMLVEILENGQDPKLQANVGAVLSCVMATSEELWEYFAVQLDLVPVLMRALSGSEEEAVLLNVLAALMSAAQGGESAASLIAKEGTQGLVLLCQQSHYTHRILESVADLICQVASYESCRISLTQSGIGELLVPLLSIENNEIRVRVLLALGMLLPGCEPLQKLLASGKAFVNQLVVLMSSNDMDIKGLSRDIFTGLAKAHKEDIASSL